MDIEKAITEGIVFKGGKSPSGKQEDKVKTKAKIGRASCRERVSSPV